MQTRGCLIDIEMISESYRGDIIFLNSTTSQIFQMMQNFMEKIFSEGVMDISLLSDGEHIAINPLTFWTAVKLKIPDKKNLITLKVGGVRKELESDDFLRLRIFECDVVSCRPRFVSPDKAVRPWREFHGVMRLNGESFRYRSMNRVEVGPNYVAAKPMFDGRRVVFEVLHSRRVDPLEGVEAPLIRNLDDVRVVFPSIVAEDMNVFLAVLSLVSRLNLDRNFWVMGLVVQGLSSAGKSYFMKNVLRPWMELGRVEEFTRVTGAYLERKFAAKNVDNMIFAIYELPEDAPQQLHLSLSEGRLRVGLVDRETGEAGEFVFEGLPFLFSTTPLETLRADIRNRVIVTSIDESDEQTKLIMAFETRLAADPALARMVDEQTAENAKRFAKYLSSLKPCRVKIPYANKLLDKISFANVKLRRDWRKLLSLLQASAILFQGQREKYEDGELIVVASVDDLRNILHIMPAFQQTLQNVTEPQRRVLEIMQKEVEYTTSLLTQACWQKGWKVSAKRIREILAELESLGYVVIRRDLGRENKYEKLADPETVDFASLLSELETPISSLRDTDSPSPDVPGNDPEVPGSTL